jgi:restriction endonuclease Mrr
MPVPNLYEFCRPMLELSASGGIMEVAVTRERVADQLGLTEQDRSEASAFGRSERLRNRFNFAKVRLLKAGWLMPVDRGRFRITDAGKAALDLSPDAFETTLRARANR